MIASLQQFWSARSAREQFELGVLAVLLIGVLAWFGMIHPLMEYRDQQQARLTTQTVQLGQVRALAAQIQAAKAARPASRESVRQSAERLAAAQNLRLSSLEIDGSGEVRIRIDENALPALLSWLASIEQLHGNAITALSIRRSPNGQHAVTLSLRQAQP
jgi:general secretion pathway protein M